MKKLFYILLFFSAIANGQKSELDVALKAQEAYDNFNYPKVIELYEDLEHGNAKAQRNLANSYWKINDLANAQRAYSRIVEMEDHTPEDLFRYAFLLRELTEYEESIEWMEKYAKKEKNNAIVNDYIAYPTAHVPLLDTNDQFEIVHLPYNSAHQEFGVCFIGDGVVFTSSRESFKSIKRQYNATQLPFLDLYYADLYDSTLNFIYPRPFNKAFRTKGHDGPATFSGDGNLIIFTANSSEKDSEGFYHLQLFWSKRSGKGWTKPQALNINEEGYSFTHPSLSADGKTLYFSSNKTGGKGGYDIYRCSISGDMQCGSTENLGDHINTSGNEIFPFIHPNGGMFFFSSDGKIGLGGQDIFACQLNADNTIGSVHNLGTPINSSRNDFSFVLSKDLKRAYFASNREGGKGSDDIYGVNLKNPIVFHRSLKGVILDESNRPAGAVKIRLVNATGKEIRTTYTDADGRFDLKVENTDSLNISVEKSGYKTIQRPASLSKVEPELKFRLKLEK